jgi:RHS repeat-associated protein
VISYKYDGLGRRIEKNVDGKITRYVYDNEDIILEYDGEGNLIAEYIHGPGIDEPIRMKRDSQTYYYIHDALGSIRALVSSEGYIRQMYEYDAFGEIVQVLDEEGAPIPIEDAIPNPYTFTGREYDPETGLYYYRARYYDPHLGRFLQEDPLRGILVYPQTLNLYQYTINNPVNFVDPLGLHWWDPFHFFHDPPQGARPPAEPTPWKALAGATLIGACGGLLEAGAALTLTGYGAPAGIPMIGVGIFGMYFGTGIGLGKIPVLAEEPSGGVQITPPSPERPLLIIP